MKSLDFLKCNVLYILQMVFYSMPFLD